MTAGSGGRADRAARPTLAQVLFLQLHRKTPTPVGRLERSHSAPLGISKRMGLGLAGWAHLF